ncbi:hypothetical protein CPC08DRAFT_607547, partial [Agrocybe pediades]
MTTPDLPTELWLEILSYLPKGAVRRLIGVNRVLFELGFREIYEEFRLISADKETMKALSQLRHPNIAKHVRRIFIQPAFLPAPNAPRKHSKSRNSWSMPRRPMKQIGGAAHLTGPSGNSQGPAREPDILLRAAKEITNLCINLEDLTITLHECVVTPSFMAFIKSLWIGNSVGPCFRRLTIRTTVAKIPLLLAPLIKHPKDLPNFEELVFDISIALHLVHTDVDWISATQHLGLFAKAHKQTITSLSISSMLYGDVLAELFTNLPHFSKLKKFELFAILSVRTFSNRKIFNEFIALHAPTLEALIIIPRPQGSSIDPPTDNTYRQWLVADVPPNIMEMALFSQFSLPNLRTFHVGLTKTAPEMYHDLSGHSTAVHPPLLPSLICVAPAITRLTLGQAQITRNELSGILNLLPTRGGQVILEEFSFVCHILFCSVLDVLARRLPLLKCLTIKYHMAATDDNDASPTLWNGHPSVREFPIAMRSRCYPSWPVRYLRMLYASSCNEGH